MNDWLLRPIDEPIDAMSMKPADIVREDRKVWGALHLGLVFASHAVENGNRDLASVAKAGIETIERAGYTAGTDYARTPRNGIARWQDKLYAVNELPGWRFSDEVLLIAWLIECGGPSMNRGPATARFEENVKKDIGESRGRQQTRSGP